MWAQTGQGGGDALDWLGCKRKMLEELYPELLSDGKRLFFNDAFDMKGHGASVHSLQ